MSQYSFSWDHFQVSSGPLKGFKGHYVLISHLESPASVRVGRLGALALPSGFFGYVGSALGGIEGRLRRYLGPLPVRPRWHIDYLLAFARPLGAVWGTAHQGRECPLAGFLASTFTRIRGFGSTDCRCPGHLVHAHVLEELVSAVQAAFRSLGREPREFWIADTPQNRIHTAER